jgi:Ca2+:H+ antiporter
VKASIIGSIIGNILLVMGASMLAGGLVRGRKVQRFDRSAAGIQSLMLLLAAAALVMPAVYELAQGKGLPGVNQELVAYDSTVENLSLAVAIVLIATYVGGLIFSLRTHREVFNPHSDDDEAHNDTWGWSVRTSVIALGVAGVAVGVMSEILVGSIAEASQAIGLSEFFIGIIVVAIVGNAAEHWVAVLVALKDKMDLSVNIAIGSSAQIALFVAPVLVLTSFFLGPQPMPLVFNGFEIAAVILAIMVAQQVTHEGESHWFEGLQLLALYVILGLTFYFA